MRAALRFPPVIVRAKHQRDSVHKPLLLKRSRELNRRRPLSSQTPHHWATSVQLGECSGGSSYSILQGLRCTLTGSPDTVHACSAHALSFPLAPNPPLSLPLSHMHSLSLFPFASLSSVISLSPSSLSLHSLSLCLVSFVTWFVSMYVYSVNSSFPLLRGLDEKRPRVFSTTLVK